MIEQFGGEIANISLQGTYMVFSLIELPDRKFGFGETRFLDKHPVTGMKIQFTAKPSTLPSFQFEVVEIGGLEAAEVLSREQDESPVEPESKLVSTQSADQTPPSKLHRTEGKFVTVPLSQVQESSWNPNEMDEETFHDLLQDMRVNGQYVVNPIDLFAVSHDEAGVIRYQIADGHNRFKAARKAGWKEIRANVYDMDEDQAKVWNYRKNRERGTINPAKEAKLFAEEQAKGLNVRDIAEKYGVSKSLVADRVKSLPLLETGIKPSHAEEIVHSVDNPEVRETVARVAVKRRLTPEQTGEVAKRVKKDLEGKKDPPKKFVRVKAEQHAREVKSPTFQPEPDHKFHCPRCRTNQVVFCGGPRNHRVVPVAEERSDRD
jgi:ParB/RepB/Spo0J family partition protein